MNVNREEAVISFFAADFLFFFSVNNQYNQQTSPMIGSSIQPYKILKSNDIL